jgi:hypothetical protein
MSFIYEILAIDAEDIHCNQMAEGALGFHGPLTCQKLSWLLSIFEKEKGYDNPYSN